MNAARCDRFRPDLSAFADGTLPDKRWEQVSYHLAGCPLCRDEVAAISSVCSTLSSCRRSDAPVDLTARLESIAGEHAAAPLYMASGADGDLPSARRRRNRRVAQGSAALLVVMLSVAVLAVLIAPDARKLTDPVKTAREQYSMSSAAVTVNEAVGAMLLAYEKGADLGESVSYTPQEANAPELSISSARAALWLQNASGLDLSLTGIQRVWVSDGAGRYRTADVRTTKVQGRGAQLEVLDVGGSKFSSSFLPEFERKVEAPERWTFTESAQPEQVAGRSAHRIQASDGNGPVANWWLDAETGLLLWAERYDSTGRVTVAYGFTKLAFGAAPFDDTSLTQLIALHPASSSEEAGWCHGFATCPQQVGGLPLVAYSSSEKDGATSMSLVYSDGFESAVVGWTEGVLAGDTARTHRTSGLPTVQVWQSGDAVITVASNGSPELIDAVAADLPGEEPHSVSLLDRAAAGFARLTGVR